ncbi:RNA polymerase sigma factor RpoD/SigA [Candidatus Poribacteria bacterium]|nr:RNA polymerase sigma factor RpoD/SigA [Candidatus Poribacteria bacterium]
MKKASKSFEEACLQDYLKEAGHHRVLTREEEVALFQRLEQGDEAAREEIVQCNLRFVIKVALPFRGFGVPLSDLIQEGNIGLLQVIDKFDWRRGFRFSTYAAYYIRQEVQAALHRQGSLIRLPVRKARLLGKINEVIRRVVNLEGREPSVEEIAFTLGLPVARIEPLLAMRNAFTSLDARQGEDGPSLSDVLPSADTPSPSAEIEAAQAREAVRGLFGFLSDREREVVQLRFGFQNGRSYSLRGASKLVGLSQEGVRRVENRALNKLRRPHVCDQVADLLTA